MFSRVKVKRGALNHFRRHARQNGNLEVHAYLLGQIISPELVEVYKFVYPKKYNIQTHERVQWTIEEYDELKRYAESKNLKVIGDIHSHPNWDAVMSPSDYRACLVDGLVVCGIVSVYGKKTRVRFWTPTSALPCEITYT
jgi:proteasome lid subunit RPN8/RPN11